MKFRNKILLAIWGVVLVMLIITAGIVNSVVRTQVRSRFEAELKRNYTVLSEISSLRALQEIKSTQIIAESPRLKAIAELGDKNTALELCRELSANLSSDLFILTNAKGEELAGIISGQPVTLPVSKIPSLKRALQKNADADVWALDTNVFRLVSVPVSVAGDLAGALTIGFKIQAEDIPTVKYMTNSDVILAIGRIPVASTMGAVLGNEMAAMVRDQDAKATGSNSSHPPIVTVTAGGEAFLATIYRLDHNPDPSRDPISYVLVKSVDRDVHAALDPVINALLIFSSLVLLLTAGIGFIISSSITQPIGVLLQGTTEISRGNYDFKFDIRSGGELKSLAENFGLMSATLKDKILELARQNAELEQTLLRLRDTQEERFKLAADLQLILESTGEGIYGLDREGRCTFCNTACCTQLGYPDPTGILGRNMHSLIHHKRHNGNPYPEAECPVTQTVITGEKHHVDTEVYFRADGSSFPVEYWSYPIRQNGKFAGAVVTFLDITQKKALESQLMRTQRLESIGTLAGGIAHDLNNVLAPLMMAVQVLKKRIAEPELQTMLKTLEQGAKRGADIVRQVLTFARGVDGERIVLQPRHVLREIENIVRETFPRSIKLETYIPNGLHEVYADATQMHQVLLNLCVNARDAMPDGGTLTVTSENVVLTAAHLSPYPELKPGPFVMMLISDTGTGIPPEILDKIYDPFFTTKEIGKGTGLGLSIVLGIVRKHGGYVNVYSEVGRGTQFKVYLPAAESDNRAVAQPVPSDLMVGQGEMILVVDDEASICEITKATLESYGYRVATARDGAEAIATYVKLQQDICVVLTDLMMPVMDGPTMIKALRQISPGLKVIATSGLDERGESLSISGSKVEGFLHKPYTTEKLLRLLREVIQKSMP